MGSGSFPLSPRDADGAKLAQAAALIDEVCDAWSESVYSGKSDGCQFDAAARASGASLAMLRLARRLVLDEVEKEEPHA